MLPLTAFCSLFASETSITTSQKTVLPNAAVLSVITHLKEIQEIIKSYLSCFEPCYSIATLDNWDMHYSPDGRTLLIRSTFKQNPRQDNIYLYDTDARKIKKSWGFPFLKNAVLSSEKLVYSVSNGNNSRIGLIDIHADKYVDLSAPQAYTSSLVFSPNGEYVAAGSFDKSIRLFKTKENSAGQLLSIDGRVKSITIQFSPDNKYLAASYGAALKVWDAPSGSLQANFSQENWYDVIAISFISPKEFVTVDILGNLIEWHIVSRRQKNKKNMVPSASSATFSKNGAFVACVPTTQNNNVSIWNILQKTPVNSIEIPERIDQVLFLSDNRSLILKSRTSILIYDFITKKRMQEIKPEPEQETVFRSIALSPDGAHLAIGSQNGVSILLREQLTSFETEK